MCSAEESTRAQLRATLEGLDPEDLRSFAEDHEVPTWGSRKQIAERLVPHFRSLEMFLRRTGAKSVDGWNDFVERKLCGSRKRSFSDIAEEMHYCVTTGIPRMRLSLQRRGDPTVAEIRNSPAKCRDVAGLLGILPGTLQSRLEGTQGGGGKRISNMLPELVLEVPETVRHSMINSTSPATVATWTVPNTARKAVGPGYILAGRYEVVEHLGSGGFGSAYLANDRRTRLQRVVKLSHPDKDPQLLEREFNFGQRFTHPNLCRYLHLDDDSTHGMFLLLEYGGISIGKRFKAEAAQRAMAVEILRQVADALDYLHAQGVVHADISPGNILIDEKNVVRVADFGASANLTVRKGSTTASKAPPQAITRVATSLIGKNDRFSAPEVLAETKARPNSDQTSLALSICAIIQGVDAFIVRPKFRFGMLDQQQNDALKRAMSPDPKARFSSCQAFAAAFID